MGRDPESGQRRELVETRQVPRIAHRDGKTPSLFAKRHGVQALGHAARHEPEDVRTDQLESLRRSAGDAVLDREAEKDHLFGDLLLEERRPEPALLAGLPLNGAVPLLVRDERLFDEEVAQARHDFLKVQFTPGLPVESRA